MVHRVGRVIAAVMMISTLGLVDGTTRLARPPAPASSAHSPDFFYLVQTWPASLCENQACNAALDGLKPGEFTIHGLWPNFKGGKYPQFCDDERPFDYEKVRDLRKQLDLQWPSLLSDSLSFWAHEWDKHGTCAGPFMTDEHSYFSSALRLQGKANLGAALAAAKITASRTDLVAVTNIVKEGQGAIALLGAQDLLARPAILFPVGALQEGPQLGSSPDLVAAEPAVLVLGEGRKADLPSRVVGTCLTAFDFDLRDVIVLSMLSWFAAIEESVGVQPEIHCGVDSESGDPMLMEVWLCVNTRLELVDCGGNEHGLKNIWSVAYNKIVRLWRGTGRACPKKVLLPTPDNLQVS